MKHSTSSQRTGHLTIWLSDVWLSVFVSRAARLSELCSGHRGSVPTTWVDSVTTT